MKPLLAILLCCSCLARAERLDVVTGPDYPPFTDPALPGGGLATKRVLAALKQAGFEATLRWLPWQRGFQATLDGQFALTFPYVQTPEREKLFLFSRPIFRLKMYVFGRTGAALDGARAESLRGLRYCMPLGWAHPRAIEPLLKAGQLIHVRPYDMSTCMRLIAQKQADFTVTDLEQGLHDAREIPRGLKQPVPLGAVMEQQTLHVIIPRQRPGAEVLLQRLDAVLVGH